MTNPPPSTFRLHVLGTRDLRRPGGDRVSSVLAQPKRLCLLTYLAVEGRPVARATLAALFWPDSDEARARNALSQAVFYLRKSLTKRAVQSVEGDQLLVPPSVVWCDARALLDGDATPELVEGSGRDLLEGWNAEDSQPLQEWLDGLRREVRAHGAELRRRTSTESSPDDRGRGTDTEPPRAPAAPVAADAGTTSRRSAASEEPADGVVGRSPLRASLVAAGLYLVVLAVFVLAMSRGSAPAAADALERPRIVVIDPKVLDMDQLHQDFHDAVRLEVLAALGAMTEIEATPSHAETATEARALLDIVGEPWEEKRFLETLVTVDRNRVRLAIVLDGGGRVYGDTVALDVREGADLAVEVPREIARAVSDFVRSRVVPSREPEDSR